MPIEKSKSGHKERLRKKFLSNGLEAFHDYEIIEMLLGIIILRKDTKPIAKKLVKKFGSVSNILDADKNDLMQVKGVGERTAILIKFLKETVTYYLNENMKKNTYKINAPEHAANYFISYYGEHNYEEFCVIFLDGENKIIEVKQYQEGTVNYSQVYPRNIIKYGLNIDSVSVVLVHNHPSGNLTPSEADINFTNKLDKMMDLFEIKILDHLIIAGKNYKSLKAEGYI